MKGEPRLWTWHVLGAGAMGCLWASRLVEHGWPLRLLLRTEQQALDCRRHGGLTLETTGGTRILSLAAECAGDIGRVDALLLATKAADAIRALESVAHRLHADSVIVLLQNGVAVQEAIHSRYGAGRVLCLTTSHGAWMRGPWHVVHAGAGQAWLGSLERGEDGPGAALRERALRQLPADTMRIHAEPEMHRRLWSKFAVNCVVNPLTALHDCRNGELLTRAPAKADAEALCEEVEALLRALPQAPGIDPVWPQVRAVLEASAGNVSSTLQDIRAGRPTELGWLNGWLIALARRQGLDGPLNRRIARQLAIPVPDTVHPVHAPHHQ